MDSFAQQAFEIYKESHELLTRYVFTLLESLSFSMNLYIVNCGFDHCLKKKSCFNTL